MKKAILFLLAASISLQIFAQTQAETYVNEALEFLKNKEYKQAQLSLQDAINEINVLLAQQVAESLPAEINGLKADGDSEVSTAGMGMIGGGLQVIKRYANESKPANNAEVQILANSPMVATISMYLSNPGMMGPDYKSVRIGTNRAILKLEMMDDGSTKSRSTEIQLVLSQTLITIRTNGFATEQEELAFANKLDFNKIRTALGE